jgi:hypothetical protein
MLSIVATHEEFRSMLLGAEIHVHTDHKILTFYSYIKTQRVFHWRTKIEEFYRGLYRSMADRASLAHSLALTLLPI